MSALILNYFKQSLQEGAERPIQINFPVFVITKITIYFFYEVKIGFSSSLSFKLELTISNNVVSLFEMLIILVCIQHFDYWIDRSKGYHAGLPHSIPPSSTLSDILDISLPLASPMVRHSCKATLSGGELLTSP